jgi:hypothetical protein
MLQIHFLLVNQLPISLFHKQNLMNRNIRMVLRLKPNHTRSQLYIEHKDDIFSITHLSYAQVPPDLKRKGEERKYLSGKAAELKGHIWLTSFKFTLL